jgi:hypothetical protein
MFLFFAKRTASDDAPAPAVPVRGLESGA